jgi:hypothetical protein
VDIISHRYTFRVSVERKEEEEEDGVGGRSDGDE